MFNSHAILPFSYRNSKNLYIVCGIGSVPRSQIGPIKLFQECNA